MHHIGDGGNVLDGAEEVGRLDEYAGGLGGDGGIEGGEIDASVGGEGHLGEGKALVLGVGGDDLAILGVDAAGEDGGVASGDAHGHHDGFGRAGGAVIHGGVGDLHAGQLADHGLEFKDGLQGALRDLRLIGRVGGEPLAARDERVDDQRAVVVVGSGAEHDVIAGGVLGGAGAEPVHDFALGHLGRNREIAVEAELRPGWARRVRRWSRRRSRSTCGRVRRETWEDNA